MQRATCVSRQGLSLRGTSVAVRATAARKPRSPLQISAAATQERFRLNNIGPAPGSRRREDRKGRGYSAGQGATCGYGMRGQNSRSGHPTRPGFEGGQMPLYRRLPKLKGICGGMGAGLKKNVVINLDTLGSKFAEGEVVSLDSLKEKKIISASGRERKMSLKVLGDGSLPHALTVKAEVFSEAAQEKITAAGGTAEVVPGKAKWTRKAHERRMRELAKSGKASATKADKKKRSKK